MAVSGADAPLTAIDSGDSTGQVKHLNFDLSQGTRTVAKPELGTKRLCGNCSAKFYDLNKTPIVCPKCQTVMELSAAAARGRPEPVSPARPVAPVVEETLVPETQDAEFVSLEEADAETQGKTVVGDEAIETADDDIELDESLDDAALIEEQEETDDDVTDIIGDREDEEEP
jgi:uncharacterized protein (TIGR02300 family)